MGRKTVYNNITNEESLSQVLPENKQLQKDFLDYLKSIDRSPSTISQYKSDLDIFFVYNLENNNNKRFTEITKREFVRFQNHALNEWQWSPKRVRRVKSVISSLSSYIEDILDEEEEYEGYRSVIKKIESPVNETVREKTIFEPEEIQNLLDTLIEQGKYLKACVVSLAVSSGRRKSELPRFKASWFTDDNVIFGSIYKTPELVQTKGRGSRGKMLTLYTFKNEFDPYLKLWMDERKRLGIESDWLFPRKVNGEYIDEPISTDTLDSWTESFSKILGKPFYYHALRHFWTTQALKSSLPSNVVQELCGWSTADMVNLYDDSTAEDMFAKYFDENGIKQNQLKSLKEI